MRLHKAFLFGVKPLFAKRNVTVDHLLKIPVRTDVKRALEETLIGSHAYQEILSSSYGKKISELLLSKAKLAEQLSD